MLCLVGRACELAQAVSASPFFDYDCLFQARGGAEESREKDRRRGEEGGGRAERPAAVPGYAL